MTESEATILREYGPFLGVNAVHGVSFDGTHIWFASGDALRSINTGSGSLESSINVTADAGTAFDGTHLFQISEDIITKIDPNTGEIISYIPAPGGGADSGLAWSEGSLWVGQNRGRTIIEINPATGRILRTIEVGRIVTGVTWVDDQLWHGSWDGVSSGIWRIDPANGKPVEHIRMPEGTGVTGLESNGNGGFFCGGGNAPVVRLVTKPLLDEG